MCRIIRWFWHKSEKDYYTPPYSSYSYSILFFPAYFQLYRSVSFYTLFSLFSNLTTPYSRNAFYFFYLSHMLFTSLLSSIHTSLTALSILYQPPALGAGFNH